MSSVLSRLTSEQLTQLAWALRAGRLVQPYSSLELRRHVPPGLAGELSSELQKHTTSGMEPAQLADCLDLIRLDRAQRPTVNDLVDLVWTGPEAPGIVNRDTSVVVREMFRSAKVSVLIAGYAIYQGQAIFKELAARMDESPELQVQMFLDIQRPQHDISTSVSELVRVFGERFVRNQWPGSRLPSLYYDPRSLEIDHAKRSSLHAKCIVVDSEIVFISSANFTEAAQTRNIEVGLRVQSKTLAKQLSRHFQSLAASSDLKPIPVRM